MASVMTAGSEASAVRKWRAENTSMRPTYFHLIFSLWTQPWNDAVHTYGGVCHSS
jgi:hypothetical protein